MAGALDDVVAKDVHPAMEAVRLLVGQHGAAQLDQVDHALQQERGGNKHKRDYATHIFPLLYIVFLSSSIGWRWIFSSLFIEYQNTSHLDKS